MFIRNVDIKKSVNRDNRVNSDSLSKPIFIYLAKLYKFSLSCFM